MITAMAVAGRDIAIGIAMGAVAEATITGDMMTT